MALSSREDLTDAERLAPNRGRAGGNTRWAVCAMLLFATSINYMDRQVLGILAPLLQQKIGWNEIQYSHIIIAFQVAYAAGLLLAGRLVDRVGTRYGYALIMGVWSLAAMSHALARTVFAFGLARFFLGLGESGNFPAAIKATAEWFPQRERSLATGIFNSGSNLGAIVAPILVPFLTLRFGWPAGFLATGFFSMVWIAWWLLRYRRPEEHHGLSAGEFAYIRSDPAEEVETLPWSRILRYRQTWAFTLTKFLTDPIWWFYLYWLPKFFDSRYHLPLARLWWPLVIVYTFAGVGSIAGGWLPAFFLDRGATAANARKLAMLVCALLALPIFFAGNLGAAWQAVVVLSLATAAHQGFSANLFTTVSDTFPKCAVGAVVGIGGLGGALGGVLFSYGVGVVLQVTHSYTLLFGTAAFAYVVGLSVLQLLVPKLARVNVAGPC
jgi:ACS family hexuronate transporter-like MFS transporter